MTAPALDLTGRTAVVTGASPGGLGHAVAGALMDAGARVLVSDHPSTAHDLRTGAEELGALAHPADVVDEDDVQALAAHATEALGRVDVLVHAAGLMLRGPTFETSLADFERVLSVNVTGTWLVDRAFARGMVERGRGAIVNTASVYASIVGPIPEPAYYASKAAVSNLTRGLAAEWGPHGVTVNCLAPGVFYPTRMTAPLADDPGRVEAMTDRTMLGRLGDPATDLGGTVVWLASDAARYVTAQTIYVDGGWSGW